MKISVFGDTIVGKQRDHNEDAFIILSDINGQWQEINDQQINISQSRGLIFSIADGMGGTKAGEVASAIALSTIKEKIAAIPSKIKNPDQVHKIFNPIISSINSNIINETKKNKETKGMGTTIVLGWIFKSTLYVTWIGDSRCYHYNKSKHDQLNPFSEDHSLVWSLVKSGEITPEEARLSNESNLILQSLGDTHQDPKPDFKWISLSTGDRILLCSDGLNSMLSAVGIQQILDFSESTKETCQGLINAANNAGGYDNITAIIVDINEIDPGSKSTMRTKYYNKSWFKGLITLLVLACIGAGIFFTNKKNNYIGKIQRNLFPIIQNDRIQETTDVKTDSTQPQPETIIPSNQSNPDTLSNHDLKDKATNKLNPEFETISMILPEQLKKSLQIAMDRIETIELKILPVQPGQSEYESEFYALNGARLESILHSLDSLRKKIYNYAEFQDHEIVRLKVTSIAEKKVVSIFDFIDNLNVITENILSSQ
jgi:protein phosphatase